MVRKLVLGIFLIAFTATMMGCSTRSVPAPVAILNSQVAVAKDPFSGDTYTVRPGDTLFAIAWYSGNDYQDIAQYNKISKPYAIYPGQKLRLTPPIMPSPPPKATPALLKPPKVKVDQSSSLSGQTSRTKSEQVVDRPKQQAYGESEQNVNNPKPAVANTTKVARAFPKKVANWNWPAKGKVIGTFSRAESGNKGLDIQNKLGSPIVATAAGKVVYAGNALRGYGNLVIIKHSDTFLSAYAHNDAIKVKEREWVKAGQQIATMGNSGTDSVKLHFEVRYRGKSLDPLRYLPKR